MSALFLRRLVPLAVCWLGLPAALSADEARVVIRGDQVTGELHRAALQAEVEGRNDRRAALLAAALEIDPDYAPARWAAGEIKLDGRWLPVADAQRSAAANPRQAGEAPAGGGSNRKPVSILRQWLSRAPRLKVSEADRDWWRSRVAGWFEDIEQGRAAESRSAVRQMRETTDPVAALALVELARERSEKFGLEAVRLLRRLPQVQSTWGLVHYAVLAPEEDVRAAAIEALRRRRPSNFVPLLLNAMAEPVESSVQVSTLPNGRVLYRSTMYREGPKMDLSLEAGASLMADRWFGSLTPRTGQVAVMAEDASRAVRRENAKTAWLNGRIHPVLVAATGETLPPQARQWWNWWGNHNELEAPKQTKPVWQVTKHITTVDPTVARAPEQRGSCFPAGTPVWTRTGLTPIEQIQPGDRVLSRDVETGRLSFQPVLDTTVRVRTRMLRLRIGGEELLATRGHPLWVQGRGWQMAKFLEPGDLLHTLSGAAPVEQIEMGHVEKAHNLVVGSGAYFVGQGAVLVHDNTPVAPTVALTPGLQPAPLTSE